MDYYFSQGERVSTWYVDGVTRYHRTVSEIVNGCIMAGLGLEELVEPTPGDEELKEFPELEIFRNWPIFLIARFRNKGHRLDG